MNPTLTTKGSNILQGTLPSYASGFNAQGDIIYNTSPKAPVGSAVVTSQPAAQSYQQSAAYFNNQQNQAAQAAANKALQQQTAAANSAASASKNRTTAAATSALEGFVKTGIGEGGKLTAADEMRVQEIQRINSQLDNLAVQMDQRAAAQVQSVIDQYAVLSRRQETANATYEGGVSTAGLASGRNRYAPEIQAGVQSAAVNSGIQALADIQIKKQSVINEIEQARDNNKYKILSDKVQQLKTLQKEERDAATQMKNDFYKEQEYIRETQTYLGKTLAPSILSSLTGDPTKDNEFLASVADQNGVSQASLTMAVDEYKRQVAKDQPNFRQEYEFVKSQGFKGTYLQYKNYGSGGGSGGGGVITKDEAAAYGWPIAMVGLSEATVRNSLSSQTAPGWFRTLGAQQQGVALPDDVINPLWKSFVKTTANKVPTKGSSSMDEFVTKLESGQIKIGN